MTAITVTRPLCADQTSDSTAGPLVFFIHATGPDGRDIMPGPFAIYSETQDQAMAEAKAAFVATAYQPRAVLLNVDELPGELVPWNGGEGLRLFGIEREASQ